MRKPPLMEAFFFDPIKSKESIALSRRIHIFEKKI